MASYRLLRLLYRRPPANRAWPPRIPFTIKPYTATHLEDSGALLRKRLPLLQGRRRSRSWRGASGSFFQAAPMLLRGNSGAATFLGARCYHGGRGLLPSAACLAASGGRRFYMELAAVLQWHGCVAASGRCPCYQGTSALLQGEAGGAAIICRQPCYNSRGALLSTGGDATICW